MYLVLKWILPGVEFEDFNSRQNFVDCFDTLVLLFHLLILKIKQISYTSNSTFIFKLYLQLAAKFCDQRAEGNDQNENNKNYYCSRTQVLPHQRHRYYGENWDVDQHICHLRKYLKSLRVDRHQVDHFTYVRLLARGRRQAQTLSEEKIFIINKSSYM